MRPITSIAATTKDGHPVTICLGDIFIMKSVFIQAASDLDVSDYTILSLLTTAISPDRLDSPGKVYFSMIGVDSFKYSISKRTENGLVLLNRGREIELNEEYMLKAMGAFSTNKSVALIDGLEVYMRTIVTNRTKIRKMAMRKLKTRLMDLSKWPKASLRIWALRHLGIEHQNVPQTRYIDSKVDMINSMIKLSASTDKSVRAKSDRKVCISKAFISTGRVFDPLVSTHNRYGYMRGVPFINLRPDEIRFPDESSNYIRAYPREDVCRDSLSEYMIICVDNKATWIPVAASDIPHCQIKWRFHNDHDYFMLAKIFSDDAFEWLINKRRDNGMIDDVMIDYPVPHYDMVNGIDQADSALPEVVGVERYGRGYNTAYWPEPEEEV